MSGILLVPAFALKFAPCTACFSFPERHLLLPDELIPGRSSAVSLVLGVLAGEGRGLPVWGLMRP